MLCHGAQGGIVPRPWANGLLPAGGDQLALAPGSPAWPIQPKEIMAAMGQSPCLPSGCDLEPKE